MRNVFSTSYTKVYSKNAIGVPMGPGRWEGKPKFENVVRVYVTCGGGMGGASLSHSEDGRFVSIHKWWNGSRTCSL